MFPKSRAVIQIIVLCRAAPPRAHVEGLGLTLTLQKSWLTGDRAIYVAMVEHMDAGIGKTLAVIDRLGLGDRTLVVFCSDNGGHTHSSNRPLSGEKATLWEGGIRVPCIARWPGKLKAGTTFSSPCITMDWTATIRRLAGISANPDREEGIDLMTLLTGQQEARPRSLFWRRKAGPVRKVKNAGRAVRRGDWKLIEQATGDRYLFNLKKDIGEQDNLIDSFPELAGELGKELDAWETPVDAETLR